MILNALYLPVRFASGNPSVYIPPETLMIADNMDIVTLRETVSVTNMNASYSSKSEHIHTH